MDEKQVALLIGARIRRARVAHSMTLSALARRANLSEAFLSRVERGEAQSSIANLVQICSILGLGLQDLLSESSRPERTDRSVYRAAETGQHVELASTGYRWHRVAGGAPRDRMEVFHLVFPRKNRMSVMVSHPGQEHCYVLSGEIVFHVGEERHHLRAGDSIFITSDQPHRAENAGADEAHVLMTVAKPEHEPAALDWWRMPSPKTEPSRRPQGPRSTKEEAS
ncbi:MAG: cupin domain-containing protein [Pseudorhodoplanes sp.]|nr:cupin domain-containing protein [Pseudorhodoplanes sp.]